MSVPGLRFLGVGGANEVVEDVVKNFRRQVENSRHGIYCLQVVSMIVRVSAEFVL